MVPPIPLKKEIAQATYFLTALAKGYLFQRDNNFERAELFAKGFDDRIIYIYELRNKLNLSC